MHGSHHQNLITTSYSNFHFDITLYLLTKGGGRYGDTPEGGTGVEVGWGVDTDVLLRGPSLIRYRWAPDPLLTTCPVEGRSVHKCAWAEGGGAPLGPDYRGMVKVPLALYHPIHLYPIPFPFLDDGGESNKE